MKPRTNHIRPMPVWLVSVIAFAGLAILAAPTFAAQPQTGKYSYTLITKSTGYPAMTTDFVVTGKKGKRRISKFSFYFTPTCRKGTSNLNLKVGSKGNFSGKGIVTEFYSLEPWPVKVTGRFTSPKRAEGTITSNCGNGSKLLHLKFVVKKGGNRVYTKT